MVKVSIKKNGNVVKSISIKGHACYSELGKDIVCAGVSSSLITTVNAIIEFDKYAIKYNENNTFYLENIKEDYITNTLLNNLVNILKSIEKDYKKNIQVKEE